MDVPFKGGGRPLDNSKMLEEEGDEEKVLVRMSGNTRLLLMRQFIQVKKFLMKDIHRTFEELGINLISMSHMWERNYVDSSVQSNKIKGKATIEVSNILVINLLNDLCRKIASQMPHLN